MLHTIAASLLERKVVSDLFPNASLFS